MHSCGCYSIAQPTQFPATLLAPTSWCCSLAWAGLPQTCVHVHWWVLRLNKGVPKNLFPGLPQLQLSPILGSGMASLTQPAPPSPWYSPASAVSWPSPAWPHSQLLLSGLKWQPAVHCFSPSQYNTCLGTRQPRLLPKAGVFIYFHLKGRETEVSHPLVHFPNVHNSQGWELHLGFPCRWQRPWSMRYLLPSQVHG